MTPAPSDADFQALREHLHCRAGLVLDDNRRLALQAVVQDRQHACGVHGAGAYLGLLEDPSSTESAALIDAVTIKETHFLRNAPQMQALRQSVLPGLLTAAARERRPLQVWSAGCATGEEAYSLAVLVLALDRPEVEVRILGTDVAASAVTAARRAVYGARPLALVDAAARERWFEPVAGGLRPREEVRRLVEFRQHNLVRDPLPLPAGGVDLVLCRNVTIYFDVATTRTLVAGFHRVLRPDGWLVLGHAETLWQVTDDFTLCPVGDAFAYRPADSATGAGAGSAGPGADPAGARRPDASRAAAGRDRGTQARARERVPGGTSRVRALPGAAGPGPAAAPARPRSAAQDGTAGVAAALAALRTGDYPGALVAAVSAVAAAPLSPVPHRVHGRALLALGRAAEAVAALRRAAYLDGGDTEAHFLLAGALAGRGDGAAAARSYRAAAGTLHAGRTDLAEDFFAGRDAAELHGLCLRLATQVEG